mgnify:CR=1 FL=1
MQRRFFLAGVGSLTLGFLRPAMASDPPADILETATADGSFQILVAALHAAGLAETLKGPGPFTLFAPTDEAFARLPESISSQLLSSENRQQLRTILNYHVVPGRFTVKDVMYLYGAITAQGQRVLDGASGGGDRFAPQ